MQFWNLKATVMNRWTRYITGVKVQKNDMEVKKMTFFLDLKSIPQDPIYST